MSAITVFGYEFSGAFLLVSIFFTLISLGANWRLFLKCEQPGWAAFVPGYNVVIVFDPGVQCVFRVAYDD